jgi:hypothetical protein
MEKRKIVRSNGAGVFFGEIVERNGSTVIMRNARRLWYWEGASSLSELAQYGTCKPEACKFPCAVDEVEVFNVIEIDSVTDEAGASLDNVKEWKQRD